MARELEGQMIAFVVANEGIEHQARVGARPRVSRIRRRVGDYGQRSDARRMRRMADKVADVMTPRPLTISPHAPVAEAAKAMRDADIGDILVVKGYELIGIVTDRDITVRVVASGRDPMTTTVGEISSGKITAVSPEDDLDHAVELMRENALRRLPVVDNGQPVGVVSIGDLAVERDSQSALADISAAPPNK